MSSSSGIVVHHLNDSRSQRILWLLEELEVSYTVKRWQRLPDRRAPVGLMQIHPLGKSPVIEDDGLVIAETGAIVQFLIHKYGSDKIKIPDAEHARVDDLYWTHYNEGSLMPWLVMKLVFTITPDRMPFPLGFIFRPILGFLSSQIADPNIALHAYFVESYLKKQDGAWFARGDGPTAADFMMLFALEALACGRAGNFNVPYIRKWVRAAHARPAYKAAVEKGGPYFLAVDSPE